jgi:hypothetical protein
MGFTYLKHDTTLSKSITQAKNEYYLIILAASGFFCKLPSTSNTAGRITSKHAITELTQSQIDSNDQVIYTHSQGAV